MRQNVIQVCKAVCAAVVFSLAYALVFAGIVTLFGIGADTIKIVNQVFKILVVVAGGIIFLRGEMGLAKGAVHGAVSVVLTWLVFCAIAGAFSLGWQLLLEAVLGAFAGGISGVIAVNVKKA